MNEYERMMARRDEWKARALALGLDLLVHVSLDEPASGQSVKSANP